MKTDTVIICEKPSQARNVRAALGDREGRIVAARGHLYELAEPEDMRAEWKRWTAGELLDPGEPYPLKPRKGAASAIREIKAALRGAKRAVVATDCDREGHLIGMEILRELRFRGEILRAVFSAEDPETLRRAFADLRPAAEFLGLERAGEARRQADQITNLTLTRTASAGLAEGRAVIGLGRVRTPTLAVVCRREEEIRRFRPRMRYAVIAEMRAESGMLSAECRRAPGTEEPIERRETADAVAAAGRGKDVTLSVGTERKRKAPPAPFDLSSLQQAMGNAAKWPAAKPLETAQSLYAERKLITYPRAEARAFPETMAAEAERMRRAAAGFLGAEAGPAVIRKGARGTFSDARLKGESHCAIAPNPATAGKWAELRARLTPDEQRLAEAVFRRFLAVTDGDHVFDRTTASFAVAAPAAGGEARFEAAGNVTREAGWTRWERKAPSPDALSSPDADRGNGDGGGKTEDGTLPPLRDGERAECAAASVAERPEKPPARYSEGGIIAAMRGAWKFLEDGAERERLKEAGGIGTAATRAQVIETLVRQGQIKRDKGRFRPTGAGMAIWEILRGRCPALVDPGMTAVWEARFDGVAAGGGAEWRKTVDLMSREVGRMAAALCGDDRDAGLEKFRDAVKLREDRPRGGASAGRGRAGTKGRRMTDADEAENGGEAKGRDAGTPASAAQRAFLRRLWEAGGEEGDESVFESMAATSAEIDRFKESSPPSEKQLAYLRRLAGGLGQEPPTEALRSASACSAEIDRLKSMSGARGGGGADGGNAPNGRRLAWARDIAARKGLELPRAAVEDWRECSRWIDENK